jgi:hypothetical protein
MTFSKKCKLLQTPLSQLCRFFEVVQDTVLVKNDNLLSFLAGDLDLNFAEGEGNVVHPKAALLSLYRALNQLSSINNSQSNVEKRTKCLSAEEITELCDVIR